LTGETAWSHDVHELLAEAEGLPFLIGELAQSIAAATKNAGNDFSDVRLDDLVKQRLTSLSPEQFRLLSYIAINEGPIRKTVAYAASKLGRGVIEAAAVLENQSLIKTVHIGEEQALDTYHDRFRSAMLETIEQEARARGHADILDTLEDEGVSGPALLAFHALRARRIDSLVKYSVAAAELAESGLAFSQAAELYHQALIHGSLTTAERAELLEKGGKASALAGSGAAAAKQLREAAELLASLNSPRVNHLEAAAAEQYLASGYLDEGHAMLKPLMLQRGIRFPESAFGAVVRMLPIALRLRVAGVRLSSSAPEDPHELLSDTDLLWSAAKGLGAMDSVRASYFNCLGLRRSLALGDRVAATKFLCGFAGSTLVPSGGAMKSWGLSLLGAAAEMADEVADPYLIGLVKVIRGQTCLQSGAWQEALDNCDAGMLHLQENASGVAWECDLAAMGAIRALEEIGNFNEMYARSERLLLQAEAVANRYAVAVAKGYRMIARIAADQLDLAEEDSRFLSDASAESTGDQLHRIYTVRGLAMVKLASGEPERAWELVEEMWPRLKASGLLFAQIIRIDMWSLRARVALASAETDSARLALAQKGLKILEKEERKDAAAWAALITGLGAWQRGEDGHVANLSRAAELFAEVSQVGMAALCRYRRAQFSEDDQAARIEYQALVGFGVAAPKRWAAAVAPARLRTG
jgi:hypothetical protein